MNIAIASGKGGTGKTTLAVNLAAFLHEQVHSGSPATVLTDLDVEEPNSGLFLNLDPVFREEQVRPVPQWDEGKCTLCGLCRKVCQFNAIVQMPSGILVFPELCHSCHACSELCPENALPMVDRPIGVLKHYDILDTGARFHFVESILNIGEPSAVQLINKTKQYVEVNFPGDCIKIYDCPPGTSCPLIAAVKDADYVILVTEPTPFGLHDLKLAVETMRHLGKDHGVVVNRHGIGNDDVYTHCAEERIRVLASIPESRQVAESYSRGELVYNRFPEFKSALEEITNHILSKHRIH
jgi:MinD superfamily P-loop ATPase